MVRLKADTGTCHSHERAMLLDEMLGPYRIAGKLGEGGMGEVYRATDTNLKRQVAIKVLPPSVADDPDRLARFQREAEVLASLNHPNIAAIYGLERSGGRAALVMELVDGPTLADRIAQGRVPIDEAVSIARQIADALDAAHEQGIIHRDLKPANIKVKPDGGAKVLDFGLAKAIEGPSKLGPYERRLAPPRNDRRLTPTAYEGHVGAELAPPVDPLTITSPAMMTGVGVILGTAAYMSPEQARGKAVDKRTDIWAFGCVLYEMLTGRCAFAADDVVATLAAVVKDQPDWNALPPETPASLRRLLQRLLEKDPRRRVRDIGDARAELDGLSGAADIGSLASPRASAFSRWAAVLGAIGLLLGALIVWIAAPRNTRTAPAPVLRVSVRLPADQRIVTAANDFVRLAISPDGSRVVYAANRRLYVRPLDSADATALPNTDDATGPFFSPDGQSIGFVQNGHILKVSLAGGAPVRVADFGFFVAGARWTADGTIVFADASRGVFRVNSAGGTPAQLVAAEPGQVVVSPEMLPGNEWVIYTQTSLTSARLQTAAYSVKTGQRKLIVEDGAGTYLPTGHLLFGTPGLGYFVAPFDPARAQMTGPQIALQIPMDQVVVDVSRNGTLVSTKGLPDSQRTPVWITRDGKPSPLTLGRGPYRFPRLSPDGTRLALAQTDLTGNKSDIWLYDLTSSSSTRLTFDEQSGFPVWTSDGRRITFSTLAGQRLQLSLQLFIREADGTGRPTPLATGRFNRYPYAWIANSTKLIFTELRDTGLDIGELDTGAGGKERMLLSSPASETRPDVSPDGQWLAYTSNETGRDEIYVRPLPDIDAGKWQVSTAGGHSPMWISGGRELVYRAPGHIMSVGIPSGRPFRFEAPRMLFADRYANDTGGRSYDVARDGRFLMLKDEGNSTDQIEIVFNWFEELKRALQTK
jgi:serine/threonine protein kinase/Tol biopolymer transport system component